MNKKATEREIFEKENWDKPGDLSDLTFCFGGSESPTYIDFSKESPIPNVNIAEGKDDERYDKLENSKYQPFSFNFSKIPLKNTDINIVADRIDRFDSGDESDNYFIEYFKNNINDLTYNLTEEELSDPKIKNTLNKLIAGLNIPSNYLSIMSLTDKVKFAIKKSKNTELLNDFLRACIPVVFKYIDEKINNASTLKRVISSDKNPEEFVHWLENECDSLGIYWSFGEGFAYDADESHEYRYTFIADVNKEDIDIFRTRLASLRFNRQEEEIRLKKGISIKLKGLVGPKGVIQLTDMIKNKTFMTSEENKQEGLCFTFSKKSNSFNFCTDLSWKDYIQNLITTKDQDNSFSYNYRSNQDEPSFDFEIDQLSHNPIETQIYCTAEEGKSENNTPSVTNNVKEQPVNNVSNNVTNNSHGGNGTYPTRGGGHKTHSTQAGLCFTLSKVADLYKEVSKKDLMQQIQDKKEGLHFDISKESYAFTDAVRRDEVGTSENYFLSQIPYTDVKEEETKDLIEKTKKVNKPIRSIPFSIIVPYLESEVPPGTVIHYGEDGMLDEIDLSQEF